MTDTSGGETVVLQQQQQQQGVNCCVFTGLGCDDPDLLIQENVSVWQPFLFFLFLTRGENIHKKSGVL